MSCPICEKRKATRFCPAKSEKICAVCCGTYREITIDCPPDCPYLIAAHRYEGEHERQLPADTPLLDVTLPADILHTHAQLMSALAFTAARFCATHKDVTDNELVAALQALAETHRTLDSGIYYEKPPDAKSAREFYGALTASIDELKRESDRSGFARVKNSDIFHVLVVLHRMALLRSNSRSRSRRYVTSLLQQFQDVPELQQQETSRIIVP